MMSERNEIKVLTVGTLSSIYRGSLKGNEAVFFCGNRNSPSRNWSLTIDQVQVILKDREVFVQEESDKSNLGLFRIGVDYGWYYDRTIYDTPKKLENEIYKLLVYSITESVLRVELEITNDSHQVLRKTSKGNSCAYCDKFPDEIQAKQSKIITLTNVENLWRDIHASVCYENANGSICIEVHKTFDRLESTIDTFPIKDLKEQVKIKTNTDIDLSGKVVISDNLVVVGMHNLYDFLNGLHGEIDRDQVETGGSNLFDMMNYNKVGQVFNTRVKLKPYVIVYCKNSKEVRKVYTEAIKNNLQVRVKSGEDTSYEECLETNTVLIDLSRMSKIEEEQETAISTIGPEIILKDALQNWQI